MCQFHGSGARLACLLALASLACNDSTEPLTARELHIVAGDSQTTRRGDDVAQPLRVRVIASDGQPFQGAVVQWALFQGEATLQPAQSTTNSMGEAETRVTNVGTIGTVAVRARVPGPPAATFSIMALHPCLIAAIPPYTLGTVVMGVLRPLDCRVSKGTLWDLYAFSLTAQQAVAIRVRPDTFAAAVGLWTVPDAHSRGIVDDDRPGEPASMKVILAPGAYVAGASSFRAGATGPYEFSISVTLPSADFCELVLVVRGIAIPQQLASTDCARAGADPTGPFYEDSFWLALEPGESLTATQSSTRFGPRLRLQRTSGAVLADVDGSATGTARIDFTADSSTYYRITASSTLAQQSGEYTFTVSNPPAAGANASAAAGRMGLVLIGRP